MKNFKIPIIPATTNKTVRFPNDLIDDIEIMLQNTNGTFSAFVIAAVRAVVEDLKEQDNK